MSVVFFDVCIFCVAGCLEFAAFLSVVVLLFALGVLFPYELSILLLLLVDVWPGVSFSPAMLGNWLVAFLLVIARQAFS